MKIYQLKERLIDVINRLNELGDDMQEIAMVNNTYFLEHKSFFLGTSEGFIDLVELATSDEDDE